MSTPVSGHTDSISHAESCASHRTNPYGAIYACDCPAGTGKPRFKVTAIIKYRVEIGTFAAGSSAEALRLAEGSHRWSVVSDKSRGGIYDTLIEAQSDDLESLKK